MSLGLILIPPFTPSITLTPHLVAAVAHSLSKLPPVRMACVSLFTMSHRHPVRSLLTSQSLYLQPMYLEMDLKL